ncbi:uncharacterized protein BKA78DRAFT_159500 [Phyllosticta capitalensis]|uniref:uncharacterized protein n=1 Tax=Phyllosticta capitalensis TaxID=121624 RepID=UPI0031302F6D
MATLRRPSLLVFNMYQLQIRLYTYLAPSVQLLLRSDLLQRRQEEQDGGQQNYIHTLPHLPPIHRPPPLSPGRTGWAGLNPFPSPPIPSESSRSAVRHHPPSRTRPTAPPRPPPLPLPRMHTCQTGTGRRSRSPASGQAGKQALWWSGCRQLALEQASGDHHLRDSSPVTTVREKWTEESDGAGKVGWGARGSAGPRAGGGPVCRWRTPCS